MSKMHTQYTPAEYKNADTYSDMFSRLRLLAISMFEWKNIPNNISVRYMEQTLFRKGEILFFKDKVKGFMCLECAVSGQLNVYEEPIFYNATSINYHERYKNDECVLIRNNYDSIPTISTIKMFASRISDMQRSIDVNIDNQKTPYIVVCDEKQRITYINAIKQTKNNEPVILANSALNPDLFKVVLTPAPFVADKIINVKHDTLNEVATFLGLNNANTDKAERLITDEVNANNQMTELFGETMLLTRQAAAKAINEKWGLDISVDYRIKPLPQSNEQAPTQEEQGGKPNE